MPQGRIVLKAICQSKKLANLKTDGARLLFTWLIPNVDINGCFSGDAVVVNGQVFTRLRKSTKTVQSYLQDLADVGLIVLYEANGDTFLCIPDHTDKQPSLNPDREAKSTIPQPTPAQLQTLSGFNPLKVKESKGKQSKEYTEEFKYFWKQWKGRWNKEDDTYTKVGKREAFAEWEKLSLDDKRWAAAVADRTKGEYTPDACRWLKHRRFEDFKKPEPKGE